MFTTKLTKLVLALGLAAAPLAGCVVNEDDAASGSTNAANTDAGNTDTAAETDATAGNTDTAGETDPTAGATDTGGGGDGGFCEPSCGDFNDCCAAFGIDKAGCFEGGLGGVSCVDMLCEFDGCTDDLECTDLFMNDNFSCVDGGCAITCDTLDDCEAVLPGVYDTCDVICGTEAVACEVGGCGEFFCDEASGFCVECLADADCDGGDFGPACTEGACSCAGDDECLLEGDVCI